MTLLDAMAHEFKTSQTSVMAATSALLANPDGETTFQLTLPAGPKRGNT
jgi:hypothetical protein